MNKINQLRITNYESETFSKTMDKNGLASDHAGFELKEFVKSYIGQKGYTCQDFGTCTYRKL